jgi:hypothetical protein
MHFQGGYVAQTIAQESAPSEISQSQILHQRQLHAWDQGATVLGGSSESTCTSSGKAGSDAKLEATAIHYLLTHR